MRLGYGMFLCTFSVASFICLTIGCSDIITPYVVVGKVSEAGDHTLSVATCPDDTVVARCFCSNNKQSSGTEVFERDCIAVNRHLKLGIQAVALFRKRDSSDYEFLTGSKSKGKRPVATCSPGFKVIACGVRDRSLHKSAFSENGTSCLMTKDCKRSECSIHAICERIRA